MDEERRKLLKLVSELLYVYSAQCKYCNSTFDYTVETADTDMLSCYCGSVYSTVDKQLVIAPLTTEEFYCGQLGRFDKRINAIYPGHEYKFYNIGAKICPFCGKQITQNSGKRCSIKQYCALHPNTLILYEDKSIRILKEEIEASYD